MTAATLTIDLNAITENLRALDTMSAETVETGAVVKANGYGLNSGPIAKHLAQQGVRSFFVAIAEEAVDVRAVVDQDADIYVFSGLMSQDIELVKKHNLIPLLNSPEQVKLFFDTFEDHPFGVQIDTGMNRLGIEPADFLRLRETIMARRPKLLMSHLACAEAPDHPHNREQLKTFQTLTDGLDARRSLAATGGMLLGSDYHFDLCRPGIGYFGGFPYPSGKPVVNVSVPVIQSRFVKTGESVGYATHWTAKRDSVIATVSAGYADGLIRSIGDGSVHLFDGAVPCPLIGRVSMDLITVDVTDLKTIPAHLDIINEHQTINHLADAGGTIAHEILTSLGARYERVYKST